MSEPTDKELYAKIVDEVNKSYKKPSAYRSMAYTKNYMKAFEEKHGDKKDAYVGKNPGELKKWRKEKWIDVKSYLRDPENLVACGSESYGKDEYPLCMKEKEVETYSKSELELLKDRKNELGKNRLMKESVVKPRGRPKLSAEQLEINKQATLERRRIARQQIREKEKTKRNAEKEAAQKTLTETKSKRVIRYRDTESADSPHNLAYYKYKRDKMRERGEI
jgi:hypothetical protein